MSQNNRTNNLIRNVVIVSDFVVLNLLFHIYMEFDYISVHLGHSIGRLTLMLLVNAAFLVAQAFFSTVVHEHRTKPEMVLKQVASLVAMWAVFNYLITELTQGYLHRIIPDVRFTLYFVPVLFVGIIFSRFIERCGLRHYRRKGRNMRRVVFVGSSPALADIYNYLIGDDTLGYCVTGYYSDEEMENCPVGLTRKGTLADLTEIMKSNLAPGTTDELYCSLPSTHDEATRSIIRYCNNNVVHFYYVPAFSGVLGHTFRQELVGETIVFTNYEEPLMRPGNKAMKRAFDIVFSACVLVCLLPFIPLIALIIKLQSPGPVFFKQERTGVNGRNFNCYKFRSMHVNKDADKLQATKNDPRKFAFGNFMRKSNIDELPQFLNVLKGDMSIVGPRPHMLHHTEVYRKLIDHYMVRHFVKPGITGWAQVTGYRGETKELWQMEGRVQRDIWYIEHWSIWLDFVIIWKTAKQLVVRDKNAY